MRQPAKGKGGSRRAGTGPSAWGFELERPSGGPSPTASAPNDVPSLSQSMSAIHYHRADVEGLHTKHSWVGCLCRVPKARNAARNLLLGPSSEVAARLRGPTQRAAPCVTLSLKRVPERLELLKPLFQGAFARKLSGGMHGTRTSPLVPALRGGQCGSPRCDDLLLDSPSKPRPSLAVKSAEFMWSWTRRNRSPNCTGLTQICADDGGAQEPPNTCNGGLGGKYIP